MRTCAFICVVALAPCLTGLGAPPDSPEIAVEQIFSGGIPQTVVELQAMQRRQQELAERLKPFAVAVRIGPAQGSGVLVSGDGYVLTAAHVAGQPGRLVLAFLSDGRAVRGRTLGVNRSMDAGLLKLDPPDGSDATFRWPHAQMGRADQVKPGQWVMALGHPGGYDADRPAVVRIGRVLAVRKNHLKTDCGVWSLDEDNAYCPHFFRIPCLVDEWSKTLQFLLPLRGSAEYDDPVIPDLKSLKGIVAIRLDAKAAEYGRRRLDFPAWTETQWLVVHTGLPGVCLECRFCVLDFKEVCTGEFLA